MSKLSIAGICLTGAIAIVQLIYWYPILPDPLPVHFDGAGRPDRMGSRAGMVGLNVGLQLLFLVGFPVLGLLLPKFPDASINLPKKDYWLDESRRESTLDYFKSYLAWIGIATSWLMITLFHLTAMVAIQARTSISPEFWIVMVGYLVLVLGSCLVIWLRFNNVDASRLRAIESVDQP